MLLTGRLSWLKNRSLSHNRPRRRRRPVLLGGVSDWLLEDRCLLSGDPVLPADTTGITTIAQVVYNGVTGTDQKTITITNNSSQTIYPFIRGQNSNQAVSPYQGTGEYDPYDPSTQDYRGYIGYTTDGTNYYAGLPAHSTITITNIPMVFWDSGRIFFTTDGTDLLSTYGGPNGGSPAGAPFYFFQTNTQSQYYLHTQGNDLTKLYFTPEYSGFDANGMPTTTNWVSPVTSGSQRPGGLPGLAPGKYNIIGPGVPANDYVTVDANNAAYVTLNPSQSLASTQTTQLYTLNASPYPGTQVSPTDHYVAKGYTLTTQGSASTTDGAVMWYHAQGTLNPNDDAPFQLTEVAFRSNLYNTPGFQALMTPSAFADAKDNAINYDISMVDSINIPVAMEASNAIITYTNTPAPMGWVGSGKSLDPNVTGSFQQALAAFTAANSGGNNENGLGSYFGGRGYPSYAGVEPGKVKLPGGFNLFAVSPASPNGLADVNYYKQFADGSTTGSQREYALTSAGIGPITLSMQGAAGSAGHDLVLSTGTQAYQYALNSLIGPNVNNGLTYNVTSGNGASLGTITGLLTNASGTNVVGVTVSGDVPANADGLGFTFALPGTDYATSAIEKLWYSWANYYVTNVSQLHPVPPAGVVTGTVSGNLLTLNDPSLLKGLVPGMVVTSPDDSSLTCFILSIDQGGQIHLSETLPAGVTHFTIANPSLNAIAGYSSNTPLFTFDFPSGQTDALAFAQTVYTVMGAFSHTATGASNPGTVMLANIIGGLFGGFYPNGNADTTMILTNMSKSALRGVPDFTSPLYSNPSQWYPDPALPTGGQTFNVYNLDPYIWFVHSKLVGGTAYAFALDDDTSDVEAKGATSLDISVGGLDFEGLTNPNKVTNQDPFSPVSPWGVVTTGNATASATSSAIAGMSNAQVVGQISQYDYNHRFAGTLVNGPGVQMGTTVQITKINASALPQSSLIVSNPLGSFDAGPTQFTFFGPFTFTGIVLGTGQAADTIILDSPEAYNTLLKLAASPSQFQNIRVTGEGIAPTTTVAIKSVCQDKTTGQYTVELTSALDPTLVSQKGGSYAYTFGSPVTSAVSDFGFEWDTVQNVTGEYLPGSVLNPSGTTPNDWTFADFSASQFAGIAYDQGGSDPKSTYTNGNGPAPQGLQVGFIQGQSSITSSPKSLVTLVPGTYDLTFYATQAAPFFNSNSPQSLNVLLLPGNNLTQGGITISMNGPITPPGVTWASQPYSLQFTVGLNPGDIAPGQYALKFQGTATGSSTALIDGIGLSQSPTLGSPPPSGGPPPPGSTVPKTSLSPLQKLERGAKDALALAQDEVFKTIGQIILFADRLLGIVPTSALENSLQANQNAINVNPAAGTLLGQWVIGITELETLGILAEALIHFGPGPS
jgi:hypothetical protein